MTSLRALAPALAALLVAAAAAGCLSPAAPEGGGARSTNDPVDVASVGFAPAEARVGEPIEWTLTLTAQWGNVSGVVLDVTAPGAVEAPASVELGDLVLGEARTVTLRLVVLEPGTHLVSVLARGLLDEQGMPVGGQRQVYAVAGEDGSVALHLDHLPVDPEGRAVPCETGCGDDGAPPADDDGERPSPDAP